MQEKFPEEHSVWEYFENVPSEIGARKVYAAQSVDVNQKVVVILYRGIESEWLNAFLIPLSQYAACLKQRKDPFTDESVTETESFRMAAGIVTYKRTSLVGCLSTKSQIRTFYEECSHTNLDEGLERIENGIGSRLDGLEKLLKFAAELPDS